MPAVTIDQARELLTAAIQKEFAVDELLEIHNEVFPDRPATEAEARTDPTPLIDRLVEHLNSGLQIDEFVELFRLVFIRHRNVWYNEEEDLIYYNEGIEVEVAE